MKKLFIITFMAVSLMLSGQVMAAEEGATTGTSQYGQESVTQTQSMDQQSSSQFHRASKIIGANIKSQQGEELGSIKDLMLSDDGKAEFIVISKGGTLGIGDRLIPVPYSAAQLQASPEGDSFTVSLDNQTLENAPSFASNELEDVQGQWQQEARGYFETGGQGQGMEPVVPDTQSQEGMKMEQETPETRSQESMEQQPGTGTTVTPQD